MVSPVPSPVFLCLFLCLTGRELPSPSELGVSAPHLCSIALCLILLSFIALWTPANSFVSFLYTMSYFRVGFVSFLLLCLSQEWKSLKRVKFSLIPKNHSDETPRRALSIFCYYICYIYYYQSQVSWNHDPLFTACNFWFSRPLLSVLIIILGGSLNQVVSKCKTDTTF